MLKAQPTSPHCRFILNDSSLLAVAMQVRASHAGTLTSPAEKRVILSMVAGFIHNLLACFS
jgi:hypothetical protein